MAVSIRLRRTGTNKSAKFRLVVADSRMPRDGRFIETLGHYNPQPNPVDINIKVDRYEYWVAKGAQPTLSAKNAMRLFRKQALAQNETK